MALLNHSRGILKSLQPSLNQDNLPLLIFVNKGIEVGSNALTLEIIVETCGSDVAKAATFIVIYSCPSLWGSYADDFLVVWPLLRKRKYVILNLSHQSFLQLD